MTPPLSLSLPLVDEFGAEGFSGLGLSHGGSFRGGPPSQASEDQDHSSVPGPAPGIGFASGPGSAPSGPPTTNYNNIHIPPGAHAPANTPAELPPPTGTTEVGCVYKQRGHMSTRWSLGLVYSKLSSPCLTHVSLSSKTFHFPLSISLSSTQTVLLSFENLTVVLCHCHTAAFSSEDQSDLSVFGNLCKSV